MKIKIRCRSWEGATWYTFPDGRVCRADPASFETYKTWNELYKWGQVPFVLY